MPLRDIHSNSLRSTKHFTSLSQYRHSRSFYSA